MVARQQQSSLRFRFIILLVRPKGSLFFAFQRKKSRSGGQRAAVQGWERRRVVPIYRNRDKCAGWLQVCHDGGGGGGGLKDEENFPSMMNWCCT